MSGDHPKLILDGRKTMTRRTWGLERVNSDPDKWILNDFRVELKHGQAIVSHSGKPNKNWEFVFWQAPTFHDAPDGSYLYIKCPYGQVGDRLWVKETIWISDCGKYRCYTNQASGDVISEQARYTGSGLHRIYRFSVLSHPIPNKRGYAFKRWFGDVGTNGNIVSRIEAEFHKKQSARFMPRWASRIERIITLLRAERLRDISPADAQAEGGYTVDEFIKLFLTINHLSEDANPWNWVIGW